VPYAASDTPKERAEYSHPDMAIMYSCLSYYHEGLTKTQFKDALVCLMSLGPSARDAIFDEWLASIRNDAEPNELGQFDHILKVDVDNRCQLELMHQILCRSMEVVSFWMNNFVFLYSTHQFPARRVTNAWNLVDSGQAVGFSGTDDTRFLLPLDIKQVPQSDAVLQSTNGAMIDRILMCTRIITVLDDGDDQCPLWQVVLNQCIWLGVSALIDVAGLMAGSENREVAVYMASKQEANKQEDSATFRGVVYFDVLSKAWTVYELENKRHLRLQSSSLKEAECFVYFDQSRCRGSDMKLKKDACALVTLEPRLRKDKFLQGCMRMRNLHRDGQSLILAATSETVAPKMTVTQVLENILQNTVNMVKQGLITYFERGMTFYTFPEEVKEEISLESMYAKPRNEHDDLRSLLDASFEIDSSPKTSQQLQLVQYCKDIGDGVYANVSRLAEECEQELEKEVEREEEEELELPVEKPYEEVDWKYEQAFSNPDSLFATLFLSVKNLIQLFVGDLSGIHWGDRLFCTPNFWNTIKGADSCRNLTNYLRPVNTVLSIGDGRLVLVSEYEADQLLPYWWKNENPKACLHQLSLSILAKGLGKDSEKIPDESLTAVKLFRGYVRFSSKETEFLSKMFRSVVHARSLIQQLLFMRDRIRYFDRSDLDGFSSKLRPSG
jgi:hypothetical protein